ncbi:MSMEG_1061 family FMN-dependent PPOX-type flavoprotein [Kitasatospora cheerisanensis]|uniref:NTP pyrophosphohydrolase n=1 Tax=Kitasatospora cheerisanensis KCTC 2395 TaxID=1348663 RepID=A0A066Z0T4_9ACTN|nr:MSMEG_1061 family FMN-dependent PPOX-type flavoprotein [Kitasatospora cheerisanensis]KDN87097.1 NTP pyrophosphohydrolase [Kitasatospora cheerisanensis KCTC 2395]
MIFDALAAEAIHDPARLRELYEQPSPLVQRKQVDHLHDAARRFIGCSSLVFVSTADADGNCDATPRGGPPGFVAVLDERTLAVPDATGNRRLDSLHNIAATGKAGLLFVVPGREATLRVNGRACVSADPRLLERLTPVGKPPRTAIVVSADEVYGHCPKAFLRGSAWRPAQWLPADATPSSAEITLSHVGDPSLTLDHIVAAEEESLRLRYE